jgi:hypothetical protein
MCLCCVTMWSHLAFICWRKVSVSKMRIWSFQPSLCVHSELVYNSVYIKELEFVHKIKDCRSSLSKPDMKFLEVARTGMFH